MGLATEGDGPTGLADTDDSSTVSSSSSSWSYAPQESLHPMDANTYCQVLCHLGKLELDEADAESERVMSHRTSRSNNPKTLLTRGSSRLRQDFIMICEDREEEFTPAEMLLRQDFAANKVRWYGHWGQDLWCFLRNNNPFFAMFLSHRLHPVSRCDRWVAFGIQFLLVLFVSCAVTEGINCVRPGMSTCACKRSCLPLVAAPRLENSEFEDVGRWERGGQDALGHLAHVTARMQQEPNKYFCCTSSKVGIIWFIERFGKAGGVVYMVTVNSIFTIAIFQLLMCLPLQSLGPRLRELGELLGKIIVLFIVVGMAYGTPALLHYIWINRMGWYLLGNFLSGKVVSILFVTLLNVTGFTLLWWRQRPLTQAAGEGAPSHAFHVTAEDYREFCLASGLQDASLDKADMSP